MVEWKRSGEAYAVEASYVQKTLRDLVADQDLSRYVL